MCKGTFWTNIKYKIYVNHFSALKTLILLGSSFVCSIFNVQRDDEETIYSLFGKGKACYYHAIYKGTNKGTEENDSPANLLFISVCEWLQSSSPVSRSLLHEKGHPVDVLFSCPKLYNIRFIILIKIQIQHIKFLSVAYQFPLRKKN